MTRTCEVCGKIFDAVPARVKRGGGRFCSGKCRGKAQTKRPIRQCEICGKDFSPLIQQVDKGWGRYCSKRCYGDSRTTKQERTCLICGVKFFQSPSQIALGRGKHCSPKCQSEARNTRIERACEICGNHIFIKPSVLMNGGGKYCSNECRGIGETGEANHRWKGGITPENAKVRGSTEYAQWRESVFARDNWACQDCGKKGNIHAHHVFAFAEFPEHRLAPWNGVTLCVECHSKVHPRLMSLIQNKSE